MQFGNRVTLLVSCFRVVPTIANHIGRETTIIVVICLQGVPAIRTRGILHVSPLDAVAITAPTLLLHPTEEQLILAGVVIIRHLIRNSTEGSILGQRQTIVIGLNMVVALTFLSHRLRHNAPKQTAAGIARHHIGVNAITELMLVQTLYTILRFSVLRSRLSSHRI